MSEQETPVKVSPPGGARPPGGGLADFVGARITGIQEQYVRTQPTSRSRAVLAQLRRGLGKPVGELPELLEHVVDPQAHPSRGNGATPDEQAAYTAITLYALHQQSQRKRMHVHDRRFGQAVGRLRFQDGAENQGVLRRFQALATASSVEELVHHARGLITLLRGAGLGFDYGRFAEDLARYQNPTQVDAVRLAWGRDFYRTTTSTNDSTAEEQS